MAHKTLLSGVCLLVALLAISQTGCGITGPGPEMGIFAYPIPVSPYVQDQLEDKWYEHERYDRMPILPPPAPGAPVVALDVPSDDEVMRTLERAHPVEGGIPFFWERSRNNVRIVKEKIADYLDPPRVVPLIGPVQLHHAHYKCTVYYTEITRVGWPKPHTLIDEDRREVIYIDHNNFYMVGNVKPGSSSAF